MKPLISFICGGIRPQNWEALYDSIVASVGRHSFELVICGPHMPTGKLDECRNFKFIKDWGSSCRATQLAIYFSEGRLITLAADDGAYLPGAMERAIDHYLSREHQKLVLGLRYGELGSIYGEAYWTIGTHGPLHLAGLPQDAIMVLNHITNTDYLRSLGGYESDVYSHTNWSGHSLMARFRNDGAEIALHPEGVLLCTHEPGMTGTHTPIHLVDSTEGEHSQYKHFVEAWNRPNDLTRVDFESWRRTETVWALRFGG